MAVTIPVCNSRAVHTLADFLKSSGELLPVTCEGEDYFLFNVTRLVDALDEDNCDLERFDDGRIMEIDRYSFLEEKLTEAVVLKLRQDPIGRVYVTDPFVERVKATAYEVSSFASSGAATNEHVRTIRIRQLGRLREASHLSAQHLRNSCQSLTEDLSQSKTFTVRFILAFFLIFDMIINRQVRSWRPTMNPLRYCLVLTAIFGMVMLAGCAEDTIDLKQKIAELEKKIAGQEKTISEFAGKQSQVKDFSADIQRLDDQQEKTAEIIKTKVDPINMKLEEFREWAQEAQGERGKVTAKLKTVEQSLSELQKRLDAETKGSARFSKELAECKKTVQATAKGLEDLSKGLSQVQREVLDGNTKLVEAVKKTLPKVKTAAVEEIKERLVPLEHNLTTLKARLETDRKTIESIRNQPQPDGGKNLDALRAKINEIEDLMASQKSYLLEIGSKLHELESAMRGGNARSPFGSPELSRR